ncbi:hypothetical protein ENUP19_0217G0014 [Entamoeba nuttalli]|uniref:Uncharacterized protein n=1 Tax=Entamoeba nuttalli TaxID=412467 RepID=A0ABQ0DPH1_9EUKA
MNCSNYDVLCDRFKLLMLIISNEERIEINKMIHTCAVHYDFNRLLRRYKYYHFYNNTESDIVTILKFEFVFILSIVDKIKMIGIESLTQETIRLLSPYLNDWWFRDGIADAWDVALELYNREEMEIELGLKKL